MNAEADGRSSSSPMLMSTRIVADLARHDATALALFAPGRPPLSFGGLLREVGSAVDSLAMAGLGQGDRVAVALPNGPELAVALLAVMDCATCAPLNPGADEDMCRYLFSSMHADALIVAAGAETPAACVARELGMTLLRLAFSPSDPAGTFTLTAESARAPVVAMAPAPDTVSLLLHTSGTTARPKLVPLTSRNLHDSARLRAGRVGLGAADRAVCVAPMFTASGIKRNLLPTLWSGAGMVCTQGFVAEPFFDLLREYHPTFYTGSPTIHRAVLDRAERLAKPAHSLRFVMSTSAPLPDAMHERFEAVLGVPLIQAYAMTEAGAIAESPLPPGQRRVGSVGLPATCEVKVCDAAGARCRTGEIGEIVVRGPEMFAGYEGDVDATNAAFRDGWFRTGDLGHLDEDGYLYLGGRVKDLINRGGFKVSPQEVDAVLLKHPAVLEAATFAVAHPTLGEDVAAVVVLRETALATGQQLREHALERLTAFKVPSRITVVESIPRTVLGKVRRRELGEVFAAPPCAPFVAPSGAYEMVVAQSIAEVLGVERISARDNFFELGGDSLRGAEVVARINASLALELGPASLFRWPVVAELAAALASTAGVHPRYGPPPIVPRPRGLPGA